MKKAEKKVQIGQVSFVNCTIVNNGSTKPAQNKLKNATIFVLLLVVAALVVSHFCPELLPELFRCLFSVATGI